MKQRRAAFALGILILVAVGVVVAARRFVHRAHPDATARGAHSTEWPKLPVGGSAASAAPTARAQPAPRERPPYIDTDAKTLSEQREALFANMKNQLDLRPDALDKIEAIFNASGRVSQGDPSITKHPMTRAECRAIREQHPGHAPDPRCGAPNMVPLFDPAKGETAD